MSTRTHFRRGPPASGGDGGTRVPAPRTLLWVRPDAVGDNLIALGMIPHLARRYPQARLVAVCQEVVAPLYQACPHVAEVVAFERQRALTDQRYLAELGGRIAAVGADLVLHSVHSREALGDLLVHAAGAREAIGFGGDLVNMTEEQHRKLDPLYTRLLPALERTRPEVERHRAFLRALGCEASELGPRLWLRPEDEVEAERLLAEAGVPAGEAIAVFPGSKAATRLYPRLGEAVRPLAQAGRPLLVIGTLEERALGEEVLRVAGGRGVNLCQGLPLRVTGALLKRCRLGVGVESGLVQLAAAVGLPTVVAYGGSFFARFLPASPLTSLALLPLDCFRCDGRCRFQSPHCLTELSPAVVGEAIRQTLAGPSACPRLFAQAARAEAGAGPRRVELARLLDPAGLEVIQVDAAPAAPAIAPGRTLGAQVAAAPAAQAASGPRTTVICAVWHRDPQRLERLRGHQACLDAQLAPVDRVYVFDGGDAPPGWLRGRVVTSREPLGLYEAWNVAVPFVRTPYLMNLNLDDRLGPDAVRRYEQALDAGADLVGGDWRICFSQEETDAVEPCAPAATVPFSPEWPPLAGRTVRLGSGTGERGTYGPACAWRLALHALIPRYPWKFGDGSPIRVIGDAVWWALLARHGKRLQRLPLIVGRYLSDPAGQAEFRSPGDDEHQKLGQHGVELL